MILSKCIFCNQKVLHRQSINNLEIQLYDCESCESSFDLNSNYSPCEIKLFHYFFIKNYARYVLMYNKNNQINNQIVTLFNLNNSINAISKESIKITELDIPPHLLIIDTFSIQQLNCLIDRVLKLSIFT